MVLFCKKERLFLPRHAVASLEFALITPVFLCLVMGLVDTARAFLIMRQIHSAARVIAENAAKLSVTINGTTGTATSTLTYDQMTQAMSTIFAVIPGLDLGTGGGLFPGNFHVVLSSVVYSPTCKQATNCQAQYPWVYWSAYLDPNYLGATGPQWSYNTVLASFRRRCTNFPLTTIATWPDTNQNYFDMVNPNLASGGANLTIGPQLVADVEYTFTPYFPLLFRASKEMYASASVPVPVGDLTQTVTVSGSTSYPGLAVCS